MISNRQIQLRFIDLLSVMIIMKNLSFNNDKVNPFNPIAMLPIFAGLIWILTSTLILYYILDSFFLLYLLCFPSIFFWFFLNQVTLFRVKTSQTWRASIPKNYRLHKILGHDPPTYEDLIILWYLKNLLNPFTYQTQTPLRPNLNYWIKISLKIKSL